MQNAWVCTQCQVKEKNRWSLCKLNRQASGEVDSFTIRRAKATTHEEKLSFPNAPYSKKSPNVAMKQHRSVIGYIQEPYRDLHERIMLPPKKRICMNMEISDAQYQDQRLNFGKEARMASNDAGLPTFNSDSMSSLNFRIRDDLPGEAQKIVKPGAKTSSNLSVDTGGPAKDLKPSRLLLRRYKLLSEIV
ncbi:hypothetical protein O6H91_03G030000 [Diphasiastrum complanatum]|nr:hypothetical protein O6H91_03G030000 [Diphasiastrum complanatum]